MIKFSCSTLKNFPTIGPNSGDIIALYTSALRTTHDGINQVKASSGKIFNAGILHEGYFTSGGGGGLIIGIGNGIFGRGITFILTQTSPKSLAEAFALKHIVIFPY